MPELPEVERARRHLHRLCVGKIITSATGTPDEIVYTPKAALTGESFAAHLTGNKVTDSFRRGKYFGLTLERGPHVVAHFGMTGNIVQKGGPREKYMDFKQDDDFPPRFCKLLVALEDGTEWAFADGRRLARIRLVNDPFKEAPLSELGRDALLDMPTVEEFTAMIRKRKTSIKAVLLDQSVLAGIGNWIADEVLYNAKIHPAQGTKTLTDTELATLHASITSIVGKACEVDADSDQFPKEWLFHYRWGKGKKKVSVMPNGDIIEHETHGGRTSAIVPAVQVLRGGNADDVEGGSEDDGAVDGKKVKTKAKRAQTTPKKKTAASRRKKNDTDEEEEGEEEEDEEEEVIEKKVPPKKRSTAKKNVHIEQEDLAVKEDEVDVDEKKKASRTGGSKKANENKVEVDVKEEGKSPRKRAASRKKVAAEDDADLKEEPKTEAPSKKDDTQSEEKEDDAFQEVKPVQRKGTRTRK
ncbi:hypothetical protein HDU79_003802 [Rhizoclosmatium sp. JEL0117]|nr:hypothetical protein HDU79_003802 [Rhizoclosmatium sp. JEL0117]